MPQTDESLYLHTRKGKIQPVKAEYLKDVKKQNRLISFFKTPVFMAKEYLHRRPDPNFDWHFSDPTDENRVTQRSETLKRDGFVLLPGYFQGEKLERLKSAFEKAIDGRVNDYDPDSFLNTDFVRSDPVFLEAALDDHLLEVIGRYFSRKFSIGRSSAMRHLPTDPIRYGSYQWHHDCRGRQVHLMVLLTDMPKDGQKMSYLKGSHTTYYTHYRGLAEGSRFEKEVTSLPDLDQRVEDITGPAGTVAIFDSNGLHTGYRNQTATRDTLIYCYVSKRHFRKLTCRKEHVEELPELKRRMLSFNPYFQVES